MSRVMTKLFVAVRPNMDMVEVQLGSHTLRVPYQTAFEIASGIRVAAKTSMSFEKTPVKEWREISEVEDGEPVLATSHQFRRSKLIGNVNTWSIAFEGALVVIRANELELKLHYSEAFPLHQLIRQKAREAKAWAGDTSRSIKVRATLSDAEENYKRGVC